MKIIVDKMPNEPKECIFSECTNQDNYVCNLHQGRVCEPNRCNFLKPIAKTCVLNKDESDTFNAYLEGDMKIAFGNTDWNHIYRKIVGNNSSEFAEKCMENGLEI